MRRDRIRTAACALRLSDEATEPGVNVFLSALAEMTHPSRNGTARPQDAIARFAGSALPSGSLGPTGEEEGGRGERDWDGEVWLAPPAL